MHSSVEIFTTKGGMTSHAAVVARGIFLGNCYKPKKCVVGASEGLKNYRC